LRVIVGVRVVEPRSEPPRVPRRVAQADAAQLLRRRGKLVDAKAFSEQRRRKMVNHRTIAHRAVARGAVRPLAFELLDRRSALRPADIARELDDPRLARDFVSTAPD